jgi:poly(3-hydroxybutyrate) depolymerase
VQVMTYHTYELSSDLALGLRCFGRGLKEIWSPWVQSGYAKPATWFWAAGEMMARAGLTHHRPAYDIGKVSVGNQDVEVSEETAFRTPFGTLTHFAKEIGVQQPRVLVVAPLSGHFATLLRHTVRTLVTDHDVYITDWANARDVPTAAGRFGFDDYVDHIVRFLDHMGPDSHIVAVCQPAVQTLAAAALMGVTHHPAIPASMTLMAGPVDTSINPTKVNRLAASKPISWFEDHLIATVPARHLGAGRRVYPGFLQLMAFMSMNADRHMNGHRDLFWHLVNGEASEALQIKGFYDEYFAVLDLAAEFYLETVKSVFQDNDVGRNQLKYRGQPLDLRSIRKTALLTVEGERDDICSVGQTVAAHDLCSQLPPFMKRHHLQTGVGHYGVFSGRRWESQVYPVVRNFILSNN